MLEMTLGHADSARRHLEQVDELGSRYGNNWLEASARTQLASLAVSAGELDAARTLLDRSVDAIDATHLSTLTLTFALVTAAQLALADGDPRRAATALGAAHGLRRRAGLTAWPLTRRREASAHRARRRRTATQRPTRPRSPPAPSSTHGPPSPSSAATGHDRVRRQPPSGEDLCQSDLWGRFESASDTKLPQIDGGRGR